MVPAQSKTPAVTLIASTPRFAPRDRTTESCPIRLWPSRCELRTQARLQRKAAPDAARIRRASVRRFPSRVVKGKFWLHSESARQLKSGRTRSLPSHTHASLPELSRRPPPAIPERVSPTARIRLFSGDPRFQTRERA